MKRLIVVALVLIFALPVISAGAVRTVHDLSVQAVLIYEPDLSGEPTPHWWTIEPRRIPVSAFPNCARQGHCVEAWRVGPWALIFMARNRILMLGQPGRGEV